MKGTDPDVLAERVSAVERHLGRVDAKLPESPEELAASADSTDAVVLHLWLAIQIVIDLAVALCVRSKLGAPESYAAAFRKLAEAGVLEAALAERLGKAAGLRNVIAHAYETLDLARVHAAARHGPADLRAFLRVVRDREAG